MSTDTGAEAPSATGAPPTTESRPAPSATGTGSPAEGSGPGATGGSPTSPDTAAGTPRVDVSGDEAARGTPDDTAETTADEESTLADPELVRERKFEAIGAFGRSVLKREADQGNVVDKAEKGKGLTTREAALFMFEQMDTGELYTTDAKGKFVKLKLNDDGRFTDPDGNLVDYNLTNGNALVMPRLTDVVGADDEVEVLRDGEATISRIIGINDEGDYICQFAYPTSGNDVMEEGTDDLLTRALPKELIMSLQIQAEMDAYREVAPDNQTYNAYLDALSGSYDDFEPDDELDMILEKAAETEGLPTSQAIRSIIEEKYQDVELPAEVASLIDKFDQGGVIVLSQDQFQEAMSTLGVNSGIFDAEIQRLKSEQGHEPGKAALLEKQVQLLQKFQEAWKDAESKGGRNAPLNNCYREMMNGNLNFANLAKAVVEGPAQMVKFLQENPQLMGIQGLSADEQRTLAGLVAKHGNGLLWTLLIALGAIPLTAVAAAAGGEAGILEAGKALLESQRR